MIFRDLEKVRVMLKEATELDIAYAYDDLVFPEHTAFIIQYSENNDTDFLCYFHEDCLPGAKADLLANLTQSFQKKGCKLETKGLFKLAQKGEEIEIAFM